MGSTAATVEGHEEGLHAPLQDPLWSESFYFNFSDAQGRSGGFTRIALHPGRDETEGLLCVYLPRGIGIVRVKDACAQPAAGLVRAGALVFECLEPLRRWRIRYDGEVHVLGDPAALPASVRPDAPPLPTERVQLDLELTGLHEPFFYPDYQRTPFAPPHAANGRGGLAAMLRRTARRPAEILLALRLRSGRHYEQSMSACGSLAAGGTRTALHGTGHRDHSWGPRHWGVMPRMRWLTGQMDDFAFNAVYLTIAGSHVTNGYVWTGGRCVPVDAVRLRNSFDETGLAARDVQLVLTAGGRTHVITGNVLHNVPLPIDGHGYSTMYNVGWTRYQCNGRSGYGVAEFLERLSP